MRYFQDREGDVWEFPDYIYDDTPAIRVYRNANATDEQRRNRTSSPVAGGSNWLSFLSDLDFKRYDSMLSEFGPFVELTEKEVFVICL